MSILEMRNQREEDIAFAFFIIGVGAGVGIMSIIMIILKDCFGVI